MLLGLHLRVPMCSSFRDTFRVCLVSKLPPTQIEEYLFPASSGESDNTEGRDALPGIPSVSSQWTAPCSDRQGTEKGSMLPDRDLFTMVIIQHS
jgi:hypothetical protein